MSNNIVLFALVRLIGAMLYAVFLYDTFLLMTFVHLGSSILVNIGAIGILFFSLGMFLRAVRFMNSGRNNKIRIVATWLIGMFVLTLMTVVLADRLWESVTDIPGLWLSITHSYAIPRIIGAYTPSPLFGLIGITLILFARRDPKHQI